MLRARIVIAAMVGVAACTDATSTNEAAVIGTWREETADAVLRYSFTPDHRVSVCVDDGPCEDGALIRGRWWIDGDDVIYELDWTPHSTETDPLGTKRYTKPLVRFKDRSTPQEPPHFRRTDERI